MQHRNFVANAWMELGWLALVQGDYHQAKMQLEQALRLYKEIDNQQQYRVKTLGLLALLYHEQQENSQAAVYGQAAVNFARKLNDPLLKST